jgi:hypothetical protein
VRLEGLVVADEPATWEALGFALDGDTVHLGGVAIRLAGRGAGEGIVGWRVSQGMAAEPGAARPHPNGAVAVDHVVAMTGDLDRTLAALAEVGEQPRRIRDAGGGVRQAFFVLETALLEVVATDDGPDQMRLWGVTLVVSDIDALADRLGPLLGEGRDAVQPGRRIATLREEANVNTRVAFMTPRSG